MATLLFGQAWERVVAISFRLWLSRWLTAGKKEQQYDLWLEDVLIVTAVVAVLPSRVNGALLLALWKVSEIVRMLPNIFTLTLDQVINRWAMPFLPAPVLKSRCTVSLAYMLCQNLPNKDARRQVQ